MQKLQKRKQKKKIKKSMNPIAKKTIGNLLMK